MCMKFAMVPKYLRYLGIDLFDGDKIKYVHEVLNVTEQFKVPKYEYISL